MVDVQPGGTYLDVDAVVPGGQLTLEHRIPVYGKSNELDLRANSLFTAPFYESQVDIDVRILILTLGAGIGFRDSFRCHIFSPNEEITSARRREREYSGDISNEFWYFTEGRLGLSVPLNDYVVVHNVNTIRYEDRPDRSFDWRIGVVHDGLFFKSDLMLFLKNRSLGAFAPMLQLLNFDLDDHRHTIINYGFYFVTRPGFRRRDDIFLFNLLFYGETLSERIDIYDIYGFHLLSAPITFTIAYRAVLDLNE